MPPPILPSLLLISHLHSTARKMLGQLEELHLVGTAFEQHRMKKPLGHLELVSCAPTHDLLECPTRAGQLQAARQRAQVPFWPLACYFARGARDGGHEIHDGFCETRAAGAGQSAGLAVALDRIAVTAAIEDHLSQQTLSKCQSHFEVPHSGRRQTPHARFQLAGIIQRHTTAQ